MTNEEAIKELKDCLVSINTVRNAIKALQEHKTGKWIDHKDEHTCSICGETVCADVYDGEWGSSGI